MSSVGHGSFFIILFVIIALTACSTGRSNEVSIEYVARPVYEDVALAKQLTATPISLPEPEIFISKSTVPQGGTLMISVVGSVIRGTVTFLNVELPLTRGDRSYYTFVPISRTVPVGMENIVIRVVYSNKVKFEEERMIQIVGREWSSYDFSGDNFENPTLLSRIQREDENATLKVTFDHISPVKLWEDGPWLKPLHFDALITSEFGEERDYGDGLIRYHEGVDFSADVGTPIYASNSGQIVLARQLSLRGNYVAIDHGGGLYSAYGHLSTFASAEGQMVRVGDLIGYVGQSGLSTGAHLHWEIIAHGISVDPLFFTNRTNGF